MNKSKLPRLVAPDEVEVVAIGLRTDTLDEVLAEGPATVMAFSPSPFSMAQRELSSSEESEELSPVKGVLLIWAAR